MKKRYRKVDVPEITHCLICRKRLDSRNYLYCNRHRGMYSAHDTHVFAVCNSQTGRVTVHAEIDLNLFQDYSEQPAAPDPEIWTLDPETRTSKRKA